MTATPDVMLANKLLDSGGWDVVVKRGLVNGLIQEHGELFRWFDDHFSKTDKPPSEPLFNAFMSRQWQEEQKRGQKPSYDFDRQPGVFNDPVEVYCDLEAAQQQKRTLVDLGLTFADRVAHGTEQDVLDVLDTMRTTIRQEADSRFRVVPASELRIQEFTWLWEPFIPFGELTLLVGDPKLGKSVLSLEIAAKATTGNPLPGEDFPTDDASAFNVLLVTNEDHPERVLLPRLRAAGADTARVFVFKVGSDLPTLPSGIDWIHSYSKQNDIGMVILDPLDKLLDDHINSYRGQDVKNSLGKLADLAHEIDIAAVVVHHLNKFPGNSPIQRLSGAIAIAGTGRSILLMARHPDDRLQRVLANAGGNYAEEDTIQSLAFSLHNVPEYKQPVIHWDSVVDFTAEELLSKRPQRGIELPEEEQIDSKLERAKQLIISMLGEHNGEVKKSEVVQQGQLEHLSERTIERARDELGGIKDRRVPVPGVQGPGFAVWYR